MLIFAIPSSRLQSRAGGQYLSTADQCVACLFLTKSTLSFVGFDLQLIANHKNTPNLRL